MRYIVQLSIVVLFFGCNNDRRTAEKPAGSEQISGLKAKLPDSLQSLDNLSVYSFSDQSYDTVVFQRKQVFESNEKVFFEGYTGDIAIDDQDNVYIAVSKPGTVGIYVFSPDGDFITKFLREGRGPKEFITISDILINNGYLYILGPKLQKIGKFTLDTYSLEYEIIVRTDSLTDELSALSANNLLTTNKGRLIVRFDGSSPFNPNMIPSNYYYKIIKKGMLREKPVLSEPKTSFYKPENRMTSKGTVRLPRSMPFSRSTIVTAGDSLLFTARTGRFLIKVYDKNGNYRRAFYYSYEKSSLLLSETELGKAKRQLVEEHPGKVPDTWPVIHNMVADDEGRFWVQTITDSESSYQGWVLGKQGRLRARFEWPGHRAERSAERPPLFKIKNGYLYTRERDIPQGIDRIVKHKIKFKESGLH
ncbi:6-bladed beta-propeller protein [Fodinibius salinus]|uniref:6-bladed beta-propeller protein n=1 Tax=Fodinibius salinus TaxID=860790 RepID=A0A5D3YNR0_9BACT|nr:6-bladed beta-propeller [Fodinibius salinus]TYP95570.1 6-bladed beta-propeller protein [Fodinibius salinus]